MLNSKIVIFSTLYMSISLSASKILVMQNILILTIMDIGYVQLARPQSAAAQLTNPSSLVSDADIADHP